MPSMKTAIVAALAAVASALPAPDAHSIKLYELAKRQNAAALAAGLTDIDILQFALTLEWLEAIFYQQGFLQFPPEQFTALGLNQQQVTDLASIRDTEFSHVTLLQSAIAQAGTQPVQPCQYNFGFTDAAGMVATAAILENVGVSAYLGAAPLVTDGGILGTAGSILTVEARHQSTIRAFTGQVAVPQAFDSPLSPMFVFSLAAPFIASCPEGSNLILTAFPTLTQVEPAAGQPIAIGQTIRLQSDNAAQATHCGFTTGGVVPGGTAFAPFTADAGCVVPPGLAGIVYVSLTSAGPLTGAISDDITLAGPVPVQVS